MMFSASYFALATALLSSIASTSAGYVPTSKNNVAIYYGQGPNEATLGLSAFCDNSPGVDIIPLGFLDIYPAQGNGWPGTNFASSCENTNFAAPGNDPSKNDLKNNCPSLVNGIAHCQGLGKQILLSLGGAPGNTQYQLTSDADAIFLADFLWGAFGPKQTPNNYPRPFDTPAQSNTVDGFDFDIEVIQPGEQQYYITMINQLISHFPKNGKKYLITGAPQCITPDSQMGDMISAVPFDILFVQYYNTDTCSARNWKTANPSFPSVPENPSGFSYEFFQLLTFLDTGASKNAKILFGLPGAPAAASANEYLAVTDVTPFLEAYYCQPRFGGVMVWEGIYAYNNNKFQNTMKSLLIADSKNLALPKCPTPPPCCTKPYTIASGDYCSKIATDHGFGTLAAFLALNPSLGPNGENCKYLQPAQTLCLARASSNTAVCSVSSSTKTSTTTSTKSGTPTPTPCVTCTQYYTFKSGDSCYNTWTAYQLTSAQFYNLNPTLNDAACGKLPVGAKVCVAGSTHACPLTTTTSTTRSTSSSKTSSTTATTTTSSKSSTTTKSSTTSSTSSTSSSSSSTKASTTSSSSSSSGSSSSSSTKTTTSSSTTSSTTSSTLSSSSSTSKSSTKTSSTTSSTSSSSSPTSKSSTKTSSTSSSSSSGTTSSATSTTSTTKSSTSSTTKSSSTSSSTTSKPSSASVTTATSSFSSNSSSNSSTSSGSSTSSSSFASSTSSTPLTNSTSSSTLKTSSSSFASFSNSTTSSMMSTSSPVTYTTTTTSVYTVTSCPPTVTNCPLGHVTTDILTITTTYCPASATPTPIATSSPTQYTTSVIYTTLTYTITACPATVTNCPAKIGSVTTETKALYTTICPVSAATTPVIILTSAAPGSPAKEVSNTVVANSPLTSLIFSPVTYSTVGGPKVSSSSSFAVVYQTVSVVPVASTPASKSVAASASSVKPGAATFTGGAVSTASLSVGGIMAVVMCMVGWVLM